MTLDICNYTNVKLCDEYGINKRFEFLFYNVCNLLLNGTNSNYILPIASDDTLGGIKVGDGLIITSDGVLSVIPNYLSIPKFGIEDNLGIQDREVDMETFSFEMFSIDPDFNSYSAFLLDGSSSSFTASDSNTFGGVDAMINGSRMFSIIGDDENRFEVLDSGIRAIQIIGNNTYTQTFAKGNGFIPVKVNNISANSFGDLTLPLTTPDNGVISGGIVTWLQDYDYNISAAVYNIAGVTYNSPSTNITLDPSDPTFDRIDSFVLTNIGTAEYLTGTPSSSPSSPTADPNSQIEVGIALILANSTQPTITQLFIYNENIEWTVASSSTIDAASINTPIAGTVSIEGTNTVPNDYISFSDSSLDTSTYNILSFRIRPKAPWSNDKKLNFRFYSQSPSADTAVGDIISIGNGSYGFDSNNLTDQIISIPLSIFNLNAEIDKLEIRVLGTSGSIGFFIDSIKLEQGVINVYNNANNFWTNSGSDIYNTNTGNVIIPTKLTVGKNVTPTSKLDLYDDTVTATPTATQGLTLVNSSLSTALSTAKSSPGVYFKGNAWDGFNTINTATNFKIYNQARTFGNISAAGVKFSSLIFESNDTGTLYTPLTLTSAGDVIFGNGLSMVKSSPKLLWGGTLGSNEYRSAAGTAHAHLFSTDGNSIQNGKAVVKIQPRQNINPLGSLGVLVSGDYDQNILSTLNLGSVGIGTITPSPYTSLDVVSVGRGVRIPSLTTNQRDQITTGVVSITVDNGGSNYTLVPTVNIAASSVGGLQAKARAILTAGVVTSIVVEFRGSGYLSVPAVTFTNQISDITGSGAAATAVVGTDAIPEGLIIYNTDNKSIEYNNSTNWESLNSSLHLNFQEVTDNGNVSTNSLTIGSSTVPVSKLDVYNTSSITSFANSNGFRLINGTLALVGSQIQRSPSLNFSSQVWNPFTATSRSAGFSVMNIPVVTGTALVSANPFSNLVFASDNTGAAINTLTLGSDGTVTTGNGVIFSYGDSRITSGSTMRYVGNSSSLKHEFFSTTGALAAAGRHMWIYQGSSTSGAGAMSLDVWGDGNIPLLTAFTNGTTRLGTGTPNQFAQLDMISKGRGLLLPRLDNTQRDGIPKGIATIPVSAGGSGYVIPPTVVIPAPVGGGLQARAHAVLTGDAVTSIVVDFRGSNYPTAPTITLNNTGTGGLGPDGSGATIGTVTVDTLTIPTGLMIFNTDEDSGNGGIQFYNAAGTWKTLTAA